jgi:hypothetical protein
MTTKIVINCCYGGFGLSPEAMDRYNELSETPVKYSNDILRDDPILVRVVEELKEYANGEFSELKIVEIPEDVKWEISDYDGIEWVSESHRTWR